MATVKKIIILLVNTTYEDGTEYSETSSHNIQTQGNYPKERIQNFLRLKSNSDHKIGSIQHTQYARIKKEQSKLHVRIFVSLMLIK